MKLASVLRAMLPLALLLSACSGQSVTREMTAEPVSDARLHALMTQQLDVLLRQLDVLWLDQHRTPLELDRERRRKAGQMASAADDLQRSADMIIALQPQLPLGPEAAPVFVQLAGQLRARGADIEALALNNRFAELQPAIENARATCQACHDLYRNN